MKLIHAQWVVVLYDHLENKADAVKKKKASNLQELHIALTMLTLYLSDLDFD